jgi:hypothetical protein
MSEVGFGLQCIVNEVAMMSQVVLRGPLLHQKVSSSSVFLYYSLGW